MSFLFKFGNSIFDKTIKLSNEVFRSIESWKSKRKNLRIRDTRVSLFDDNRGFLDVEPKKFHERVYEPRESFEVHRRRAQRYEEINVCVLENRRRCIFVS